MKRLFPAGAVVLVAASLFGACADQTPPDEPPPATERPSAAARISGVVRLQGSAPPTAFESVSKDTNVCGERVPVTRLALGSANGVKNAFVYLDEVRGAEPRRARAAIPVEQSGCEYKPHAMSIPTGTQLEIANADPILHNVHAREVTQDGLRTIFNIAQPIRGQRTVVDVPLSKAGVVALTCEAGHPWMTAYILVADHPYTAVTDDEGRFAIDNVPAGTYRIRMWHEGVRLKNVFASVQQYEYEEPYEADREVVVPAGGEVQVDFDLALRNAN